MLPNKDGQMPRVENISCILPETAQLGGLFLGNVFGAQNPDILKEYGIRAVITTSAETNISYKSEDVPFHLAFQAHDKEDYYISEHINDCIHFIEQNRKFTNVFVHCYAGVSRSSAVISAYLMFKYRWPLSKTLSFVQFKRIVAKPNDGFMQQLKDVEVKLKISSQPKIPPTEVSRAHKILNPNSRQSYTQQINHQRPSSARQIPLPEKPHSPPLSKVMSQHFGSNPQLVPRVSANHDYAGQTSNRNGQNRQQHSQNVSQRGNNVYDKNMGHISHNQVPIPRILTRKSQYSRKSETGGEEDKNRKSVYNDYMLSPEIKPTSPRYGLPKNSMGKISNQYKNSQDLNVYRDNITETSVYSTNYSRKQFENNQRSKAGSRCLIRPRDLPGYKNY